MAEVLKFLVDAYQPLHNLKRGEDLGQRSLEGFLITNCNKVCICSLFFPELFCGYS